MLLASGPMNLFGGPEIFFQSRRSSDSRPSANKQIKIRKIKSKILGSLLSSLASYRLPINLFVGLLGGTRGSQDLLFYRFFLILFVASGPLARSLYEYINIWSHPPHWTHLFSCARFGFFFQLASFGKNNKKNMFYCCFCEKVICVSSFS